jgi:hypothetical protein
LAAGVSGLRRNFPKAVAEGSGRDFDTDGGGAHARANMCWLIATCKANRIDSYHYLVELFKALPPTAGRLPRGISAGSAGWSHSVLFE